MTLWKFHCKEETYPGMWQRWFLNQCVGVGWPPGGGFSLTGDTDHERWRRARSLLEQIGVGDHIVVSLKNHRVGRIGEVTGKAIEDTEWNPLVPKSRNLHEGEMGRRILLRWDMMCGPESRDWVVALPEDKRFKPDELRPTISRIHSRSLEELKEVMRDDRNWVKLWADFDDERSLSGYIAAYPHRLEDGLLRHPDKKVREKVFDDRSRLDVILIDRDNVPVIVECKRGPPTSDHIRQLRHYMAKLQEETSQKPRGFLIHGGATKLAPAIAGEAHKEPRVELIRYDVDVKFSGCG